MAELFRTTSGASTAPIPSSRPQYSQNEQCAFLDLLNVYDIRALICRQLDTPDLLALANSTKRLRTELKQDRWDISRALRWHVSKPNTFRNLQARTGALLTGTFAAKFVDAKSRVGKPNLWINTYPKHATEWENYIVAEGYSIEVQGPTRTRFIRIPTFGSRILLSITECPVYDILTRWEMTFEGVIITWDKAFSIFARQNLLENIGVPLKPLSEDMGMVLAKYEWPVWRVAGSSEISPVNSRSLVCGSLRRIGDSDCLTIELDTRSIAKPPFAFPVECCEFICDRRAENNASSVKILAERQIHPLLRYSYTSFDGEVANHGRLCGPTHAVVFNALPDIFAWRLLTINKEGRPQGIVIPAPGKPGQVIFTEKSGWGNLRNWKPPADWDYLDDQLSEWVREAALKIVQVGGARVLDY